MVMGTGVTSLQSAQNYSLVFHNVLTLKLMQFGLPFRIVLVLKYYKLPLKSCHNIHIPLIKCTHYAYFIKPIPFIFMKCAEEFKR